MFRPIALTTASLALLLAPELRFDYTQERTLRTTSETSIDTETVSFEAYRDGEPMEGRGGGGESSEKRSRVQTDTWLEHEDGAPTAVRRTFETLAVEGERMSRDEAQAIERETPLEGVTIEVRLNDGELEVEAVDGAADDELLEGHTIEHSMQGLLPDGELSAGDSYDLEGEALLQALGLATDGVFFRQPERDEGEGGRRGGRGGRGGAGGGGGALSAEALGQLEWDGTGELLGEEEEKEGVTCAVIKLVFEGEGQLEEPERGGGGRGRGGRALLAGFTGSTPFLRETSVSVKLEGRLWFAVEEGRPVALELEGVLTNERNTERETQDGGMFEMNVVTETTIHHTVTVTEAAGEDE